MSQSTRLRSVPDVESPGVPSRLRGADLLGRIIFVLLLGLIVFTAIPYGTAEPWWKAFFVCAVFSLCILWLIEGLLRQKWFNDLNGIRRIALPVLAFALFSFVQTIHFGNIANTNWNSISADPYQTRFFVFQFLALSLAGMLSWRYASTERRLRAVINVVIAVAVASAIFGILRQTMQHSIGFGLPIIGPDQGYGQFINRNHFAYLMEMGFGLALGLVVGGGVRRDQGLIYLAALLPLWTGLVLCNSRGGLIAMLAQITAAVLLFTTVTPLENAATASSRAARLLKSKTAQLALLVILVGGVIFGTLWMGGDQLAARLAATGNELPSARVESRDGVRRNEVWVSTWRMFAANPIVGVGMGAYWARVPEFHDASGAMTPQQAHNDYLELLASGGLIGLTIGVWFVLSLFRSTRENLRSPNRFRRAAAFGATMAIVGVAVHSLADFGLHLLINALVFTTLVVIAASKPRWAAEPTKNYA
ncbi:MAG TPA: O-antigen ligase family protein [Pyrinomonadaceae bacterium]|nr:O-antigen ligase family protein [Pyrinomonadaceae bacterium]